MVFDNKLVLNIPITCATLFCSSEQNCVDKPNIIYKNIVIPCSPNIKFLGITLTENLKWYVHIHSLHKSLNKAYFTKNC
jgi:hypothetical protein